MQRASYLLARCPSYRWKKKNVPCLSDVRRISRRFDLDAGFLVVIDHDPAVLYPYYSARAGGRCLWKYVFLVQDVVGTGDYPEQEFHVRFFSEQTKTEKGPFFPEVVPRVER